MLNKQNQTITIDGKTYELREVGIDLPAVDPPKSPFGMPTKSNLIPGNIPISHSSKEDRIRYAEESRMNFNKEHNLFRLYGHDADSYSFDIIGLQPSATMIVPLENLEDFEWTGNSVIDGIKILKCNIEANMDEVHEMANIVGIGPLMTAAYLAGAKDGAQQASSEAMKSGLNMINNYTEEITKDIEKQMNLIQPINDDEDNNYVADSKNRPVQSIKPIPVPPPFPCFKLIR